MQPYTPFLKQPLNHSNLFSSRPFFSSVFHPSSTDLSQAFLSFLSPTSPTSLRSLSSHHSYLPIVFFSVFIPFFICNSLFIRHYSCETNLTLPSSILTTISSLCPPGTLFRGGGRPGVPVAPSGGDGEAPHV